MVPKGSQRGGGQQLATHLLNEFDNDRVELADLRGAIAQDLHGVFADSNVRKAMRAIVKRADVRRRRSIVHVTRHTFGSLLIQQGESLAYVKEQMGHASIQITVDIYGHLVPGGNRAAVDRLDSDATIRNPDATEPSRRSRGRGAKSFAMDGMSGEPGGIEHVWRARRATPTCLRPSRLNQLSRSDNW
jgi:Phage integrase family